MNSKYNINNDETDDINNSNNSNEEEEEIDLNDDNVENIEKSILFCYDTFCTCIPEIYFDENSSLVYLFCNKNPKKEKHKYCLDIQKYLKSNILYLDKKLKKFGVGKTDLDEKIKQIIDDMKNKIAYQKKQLEKITNDFNDLIHNIIDDFTFLLQNKLRALIFQKAIINTYINCPNDANAVKNFKNLENYMNNISISKFLILDKYNKDSSNNNKNSENKSNTPNIKDILKRANKLSNLFNYFSETTHKLMSINKTTIDNELRRINNMLMLKDGNICFSSDFGEFVIFKLNKEIQKYERISEITPVKNSSINYITQLSNELLVCCSKKLIIGELTEDDTKYNIIQQIDEFDNYNVVKVIELSNKYLATYDRGFQISIFTPIYNGDNNNIEYQLIFNKINKGEQLCSLLELPQNDRNDVQYISTSNSHYSNGNGCVRFYSSKNNYQSFDAIYEDLNCSIYINSLLMINKTILAVGIKNNNAFDFSKDGIALIHINLRQIVTFIQSEYPSAIFKLNNDLFVVASNNSKDENDTFISQKKFNFYYINEINGSKDCLIYISSIQSGANEFVHSFCESEYCEKLIASGNLNVKAFQ